MNNDFHKFSDFESFLKILFSGLYGRSRSAISNRVGWKSNSPYSIQGKHFLLPI